MRVERKKETTPTITFPFPGIFMVIKIHPTLMAMEEAILLFVQDIILGFSRDTGDIK